MKSLNLVAVLVLMGTAFAQTILLLGASPEEHQAKYNYTRVQPLLDVPMIDPAITRGPDGFYYLTGTTGTKRPDGTVNFAVNDGIRLWRSKDLRKWEYLGLVVTADKEGTR